METATINVEGMMCGRCTGKVEKAVGAMDGVSEVAASSANDNAVVTFDPSIASLDAIKQAITECGFTVK